MKKTICLNMIVKNEKKVIQRCLDSLKKIIDYWVIVDTGSTDGTQQVIQEVLKDIPGELHERNWVNFAHNRNEAIELAKNKADYLLFIDADEVLLFEDSFVFPELDKDLYLSEYHFFDSKSERILLINNHLNWQWKGALHETVHCLEKNLKEGFLKGVINSACARDGTRSLDPEKFRKDAKILEKAIEEDPQNSRYLYLLALTYENIHDYESALNAYTKRALMGGNEIEVFLSLYKIGFLQDVLGYSPQIYIENYLKAYHFRPSRSEALFSITNYFIDSKQYLFGYILSKFALSLPKPDDLLLQEWVYDWGLLYQFNVCAFQIEKYQEAFDTSTKLLAMPNLPLDIRSALEKGIPIISEKLKTLS